PSIASTELLILSDRCTHEMQLRCRVAPLPPIVVTHCDRVTSIQIAREPRSRGVHGRVRNSSTARDEAVSFMTCALRPDVARMDRDANPDVVGLHAPRRRMQSARRYGAAYRRRFLAVQLGWRSRSV